MTPVEERLVRRIALTGPISVAQYMSACLTDPDGYYARQSPFGAEGDFVTAPEISQMFGEMIGAWLINAWIADGRPAPFDLVELGPGRGTLMADILRVARTQPDFFEAARVVLVEASEAMRAEQRRTLAPLHPSVRWADNAVGERPLYLVANELFDALPIRQFVSRGGRWYERTVGLEEGRLAFGLSPFATPFPAGEDADAPPEGAVRETRTAADTLMGTIAEAIAGAGQGAALVVDYGYAGNGWAETLQAVRRHESVDVLSTPGQADLSAHVDFRALARAAERPGAAVHGPVGHGPFLLALGLAERAAQLAARGTEEERAAIQAAGQRLVGNNDGEMGDLFKALAVTARSGPVPGFPAPAG